MRRISISRRRTILRPKLMSRRQISLQFRNLPRSRRAVVCGGTEVWGRSPRMPLLRFSRSAGRMPRHASASSQLSSMSVSATLHWSFAMKRPWHDLPNVVAARPTRLPVAKRAPDHSTSTMPALGASPPARISGRERPAPNRRAVRRDAQGIIRHELALESSRQDAEP